ncbi:MAG: RuBisCO large subunit C-terminal-like domain-containing protein [Candidatus Micrarchaeia archaeon]
MLGINGPYFSIIFKPSFSLSLTEKINIAQKFASIGGTFIKEDETYLIEKSKLLEEAMFIQKTINETSDHCFYVPNVTPHILDDSLFKRLYELGIRIVMVNYWIAGLPTVYTTVRRNKEMLFWGHRVGYRAIQRYISMKALALLAPYSGMNMIHIGTPFFSKNNSVSERLSILKAIKQVNPEILPVFTKCSHQIISFLIKSFGKEIIIMACGSIMGDTSID